MTREELQKLMLRQVATRISNATHGTARRRYLPTNVIDLALERARRQKKVRTRLLNSR